MIPGAKKGAITENELLMYLAIVLKHLRLMVLLMCFALTLGVTYYNFSKAVYHSKCLVEYQVLDRPLTANNVFKDSDDRIVKAALSSPFLWERTAKKLGIRNYSAKYLAEFYIKKIDIRFTSERDITVDVYAYSYELARDWTEVMIQEYLLSREERRQATTRNLIDTFSREIAEMKQKIDDQIRSKLDFQDTNEVTKIVIELNNLKAIPQELAKIKHQIMSMDQTREILGGEGMDVISKLSLLAAHDRSLRSGMGVGVLELGQVISTNEGMPSVVVVPTIMNGNEGVMNAGWEDLDKERRRLLIQRDEVGKVFLPNHRSMVAITKKLEEIDRALKLELEVAINRFNLTYNNLIGKQRELENNLPLYDELTRRYEIYKHDLKKIDMGQMPWDKMRAQLEKQLSILDYVDEKDKTRMRYVGYAEPLKEFPVSPNRLKLLFYSLLLGLALAIAVPFLIEYLDSRVADVEQVEDMLHIRGLGIVPRIEDEHKQSLLMLGDHKPDYHLQENFRVIRTNLVVNSEAATLPQVIIVTSSMPQEGKTMVSANLAMSFAMKGEKTLLVDGDLRRGRLHRLFGTHNKPGISDILREKRPLEDAFRSTTNENLTIMTCGKHLNSASELLDSAAFAKLVEDLRQTYQRIIIDTPPVLGLAETSIIQKVADGILFVIWSDFTPMRNVKAAIQSLQTNGGKFCGFVLNRLDFHTLGNRYRYFYYAPNYYTNYKAIEAPVYAEN